MYRMTPTYDTGPILEQLAIPVGRCTAFELARKLDAPGLAALRRVVRQLAAGLPLEARPQDERQATWAPRPTESDLRVDWTWSTSRVLRRIRALSPVPGLAIPFIILALLYACLGLLSFGLLWRLFGIELRPANAQGPHAPPSTDTATPEEVRA